MLVVAWMYSQGEVGCNLQWAGNTSNTVHATYQTHVYIVISVALSMWS